MLDYPNSFNFIFLLIILYRLGISLTQCKMICPRYVCNNTLQQFDCIYEEYKHFKNHSYTLYNLKSCPESYSCDLTPMKTFSDFPAKCKKNTVLSLNQEVRLKTDRNNNQYNLPTTMILPRTSAAGTTIKKLPGAYCSTNVDCLSDLCVDKACVGAQPFAACESHADCNIGLKCDFHKKYCNHQLYLNETGCFEDYDCLNSAGCIEGKCIPYHSLNDGETSPSDLFCKSGHKYKGICLSSVKVYNKRLPYRCEITEANTEKCEYYDGVNKFFLNCACGINSNGQGYCPLCKGDLEYKVYLKSVLLMIMHSSRCHTMARNDNKNCHDSELDEAHKNAKIKSFIFHKHQSIQRNEQCVKHTILQDFYKLSRGSWLNAVTFILLVSSLIYNL